MSEKHSPYLSHERRLSDVIAAIQVLAAYPKYASREIENWSSKLDSPLSSESWDTIFKDHPEFFRLKESDGKFHGALRWRWALDSDYDYVKGRSLTNDELSLISEERKKELTRAPLSSDQINMLIDTAVNLHSSAISLKNQKRWWIQIMIPSIVGLVGALLGFLAPIIAEFVEAFFSLVLK